MNRINHSAVLSANISRLRDAGNMDDKASLSVQLAAWVKRMQVTTAISVNVALVADIALRRQYQKP